MLKNSPKTVHTLCIAVFALTTLVLFHEFLFDSSTILADQHSDRIKDLGKKQSFQTTLQNEGEFSLWNPAVLGGMPTVDATAGDIMYPLSLPFYKTTPLVRAEGIKMVLHVFLAGVTMYLMLFYSFKMKPLVAFMGGMFYMLNPQFFSHVHPGHDGKMFVIALLPLIVWSLRSLLARPTLFKTTLLGTAISMALFTSHIQMTYFMLWGLFAYWVYDSWVRYTETKELSSLISRAGAFWGAMGIVLIIGGIQLYPAFSFVMDGLSVRGEDRGIDFVATWSLHWPEFFSLWVPEFGNWLEYYWSENPFKLNTEYVGAVATLLAFLALYTRPTKTRFFWFGVGLFSVLLSMGTHTPLLTLAYHTIPGVDKFRALSMIMFWYSFAVVLLSCLFLQDLFTGYYTNLAEAQKKRVERTLYALMGVSLFLLILFSNEGFVYGLLSPLTETLPEKEQIFRRNFSDNFTGALTGWFLITMTALITILLLIQKKLGRYTVLAILLVMGCIDTIRVNNKFIKIEDATPYTASDPQLNALAEKMEDEPFRVFFLPGFTRIQNIAGIYGLEGVDGFHDNELAWYREFRGQGGRNYLMPFMDQRGEGLNFQQLPFGSNRLNIANCRYFILRTREGFLPVENQNYLPRLSFTTHYEVMTEQEIQTTLEQPGFDARSTVLLQEEPPIPSRKTESSELQTKWKRYTPNTRKARITAPDEGILRISEVYYPGWEIYLNGEKQDIYQSDLAWMAITIPEGTHEIELRATSPYLDTILPPFRILVFLMGGYWVYLGGAFLWKRYGNVR
ncbi:YfhO family protein [Chitinivibrio alkaliphilus]|uniref:Bacterial membrane protein YfhO n=1 Tax=Chitinivibrio alkaliphilus ACht1 TaxID=1313304 RepID=U7D813_9BACT|nr:YfhO family protein [Chitinivibrio alkaliphilus]ERP39095.1 hypothetical protein CALK_0261 [Chitinivibrio alkaliphilus ACht1]